MKKLLSILAAVGLSATASTAVVACGSSKKSDSNGGDKPNPAPKPDATDNSAVTIKSAAIDKDGKVITLTTDKLVVDVKDGDITVDGAKAKSIEGKKDSTTITITLDAAVTKDAKITVKGYATSSISVDMSAMGGDKPVGPTDNSAVTIKTAAIEKDGKTIDLTTDALVVDATTKDFTVSKGTVASVDGKKGATSFKVVLKDALTNKDALTISGYATKTAIKVTMDNAPAPAPTDNSKVNITAATIDATGATITLTTDQLVVDAQAKDFKLSGATIKTVEGKAGAKTITITVDPAVAKDAVVTIAGYATTKAITIDTSAITPAA